MVFTNKQKCFSSALNTIWLEVRLGHEVNSPNKSEKMFEFLKFFLIF